ncbi:toxin-antitoxin system HicB family antitoxin [Plantactinospora solaniradicis]|uniref:Toxin-antitoxin system HicB family antitoxin n=1 Tax=Plantactinospora solaniradicis TaxID=1723736 RepID=A0ABW1KIY3_9ACTN
MDLRPYVEHLRNELAVAAEDADPDGRALAERLFTQLAAATRLTLLDALSDAADEITRELAPGSVYVRLRGREPTFVVAPASPPVDDADENPAPAAPPAPVPAPGGDDGATSRINLRLPDHLKASIEEAAGQAGLSLNAWLVRAAAGAIGAADPDRRPAGHSQPRPGQQVTGRAR